MLIDFTVENSLSIKEKIIFSMVATDNEYERPIKIHHINDDLDILPTAVIYGFNASGKSNFIKSIENLKNQIIYSKINDLNIFDIEVFHYNPYRLDDRFSSTPTQYQIRVAIEDNIYDYSIEFDSNNILSEKLLLIDSDENYWELIDRKNTDINFDNDFDKQVVYKFLGNNIDKKLAIGVASIFDSRIEKFYNWIESDLLIIHNSNAKENIKRTIKYLLSEDELFYKKILRTLNEISYSNISKIMVENIEDMNKRSDINDNVKNKIYDEYISERLSTSNNQDKKLSNYTLNTYRQGYDTEGNIKDVVFNLYEESEGTIKIYSLYAYIFDALYKGKTLIIDEMTSYIHPLISRYILELFQNPIENLNGQLITSTHTTDLLEMESLRKDQVYITDKDFNETKLYSLSDIIDVRQSENFRSAYLAGKYGGINYFRREFNE